MFKNKTVFLATKHGKEKVISPILKRQLGVNLSVLENFDTDLYGTFSGEIPRKIGPLETLREKCRKASELIPNQIVMASEGSFGPHPHIFFASADEELVMLYDKINNIEIFGKSVSLETNYNQSEVCTLEEAISFSKTALFPSHALILRDYKGSTSYISKGITSELELLTQVQVLLNNNGSAWLETDMRAHLNPKRLQVIKLATFNLVDKIKSKCPQCHAIGFWVSSVKKGLICMQCSLPTESTLSHIYSCYRCDYKEEKLYPNKKKKEDSMFCNYCNP